MKLSRVSAYDGQFIATLSGTFELGTYLGGGASGVVYEATKNGKQRFAIKILHPLGFKLNSPQALSRFVLDRAEGDLLWLRHPVTKDVAVCSAAGGGGKELSLVQCVDRFGFLSAPQQQQPLPPKFVKYLEQRSLVVREINCMQKAAGHDNVLTCHEALEFVQDSKSTFFLVLDLAEGGELFDRISVEDANSESAARKYFYQLACGVQHLHDRGVCHRDLKPENLLLDGDDVLKIADFGLSNLDEDAPQQQPGLSPPAPLERFSSVVGSSHYTAPEILNRQLYDGRKSDSWSLGVILYALLCGSLPFGKQLATCPRFLAFSKDVDAQPKAICEWFLPSTEISPQAVALLFGLLHPSPNKRFSVKRALEDEWLLPLAVVVAVGGSRMPPRQLSSPCSSSNSSVGGGGDVEMATRLVPSFQSPPLAPHVFGKRIIGMELLSLDEEDPSPSISKRVSAGGGGNNNRRLSLGRSRSTSPTRVKHINPKVCPTPHCAQRGGLTTPQKVFLQHTKRSTRFTTTTPAGEILKTIEQLVLGNGWCTAVELVEEFKMQLLLSDGRALGTVQVFLSRRKARAMYLVEFVRAHLVEIFEFKLFYRDLFPLLKTSLRAERVID